MTDKDRALIAKARDLGRFEHWKVDQLIQQAETREAEILLSQIENDLYCLAEETI